LPHIQCVTTLQSAFIGDKFIHFTSGVQDSASAINTSSFNGILSTILSLVPSQGEPETEATADGIRATRYQLPLSRNVKLAGLAWHAP